MTRAQDRGSESEITRIRLLEADADEIERRFDRMVERFESIDKALNRILFSLATGAILLALNVVVLSSR